MHTVHHAATNIVKPELRSVTARALVLLCIGNREITENELIIGDVEKKKNCMCEITIENEGLLL